MDSSDTTTQTAMQKFIPPSIDCWMASDSSRFYADEEIFDYMDGAGEIYRSYKFKDLLVQRYTCPNQEEILVELFDMGSARNAFGVYTYMQGRGTKVNIGQDGEYKMGLLCFWKDKYFVCVRIEKENSEASKAVFDLGEAIARVIPTEGKRPAIINLLPINKYFEKSLRYFYRYEILNIHFFLADGNILHINDSTDGVLVRLKKDSSYLLIVGYPTKGQTDSVYDSFLTHYMPDRKEADIIKTENKKWTACRKEKNYILIIFDAPTKEQAIISLDTFKRKLP
ncbi:MAG: hypothetical protein HY800_03380 [Ignavibacteriales bacterium]|nr:hypothetical protein [Ignavibacteriales bacterium]